MIITTGYAQDLGLKHFTVDDGLPSNTIFNLYFDSKGYMWIATDKGMARYNGIEFKTFTTNDGLPDNEIFNFKEDTEGRLWISNFKGVLCFYKDNVFHTATNTPWLKLHKKSSSNFFNLFELQKDSSTLTESVDGKSLLAIQNKRATEISLSKVRQFIPPIEWHPIFFSKIDDNHISICYSYRSFIIDSLGNILKQQQFKNALIYPSAIENNTKYLFTKKGILLPGEHIIHQLQQDISTNSPITSFIRNKQGVLAITKNALYHNQDIILNGLNFSNINHDNTGNIWVGTMDKGLYFFNKDFNRSFLLKSRIDNKIVASRIIGNTIHLVDESGNIYYISTDLHSKYIFQPNNKKQQKTFIQINTLISPTGDIISFQKKEVLYKKSQDKTYVSTPIQFISKSESEPVCKSISFIDSTFFITTMCHVILLKANDLYKKNALVINTDSLQFSTVTQDRIYYGAINKSDTSLWFSMAERIYQLKNKAILKIKALQNKTFRHFEFYEDYFIGITDDNKFYLYNTLFQSLDSFSEANCIWESIHTINDSIAVISTNKNYKLLTFYPSIKNKKTSYNLITVENPFIPKKADYIFGDGTTYYFLKNGQLSGFPAVMINSKPLPPKPIFISVETERKTYAATPLVAISYNESKAITVQIDNISFNDKELITEYSISKDNNNNWNTITGNEINLNAIGIGYGKYTIKLRSKTAASDFSEPTVLTLLIATPFWATWWFITLCVIVFLLIILGITRLFIWRQLRKRQQQFDSEMKYQQSEYKALNALMNPHFIFNSLNNIQGLINKDRKETANQYLVIFSKLIRQNMLNISKGYISLHQEMILIENYLYLEKLRFKDLINFTIDIGEDIDTETVMIPPLLIQPLVENAIIHGLLPMQSEDSKLNIRIFEVNDVIHVEIVDNGVGLDQSLKKKNANSDSYGLSNLHRRIEHVKKFQKSNLEFEIKELIDENGKTLGTKASITIEQF